MNMMKDIRNWVRTCVKCVQNMKYQTHKVGCEKAGPFKRSVGGNKY